MIQPDPEGVAALTRWYVASFVYSRMTGQEWVDAPHVSFSFYKRKYRREQTPIWVLRDEYNTLVEEGVIQSTVDQQE